MLCFLPPAVPLLPPQPEKRARPQNTARRCSPRVALSMGAASVGLALLTPFGWMHPQPTYVVRTGERVHIGLRPEDYALRDFGRAGSPDRKALQFVPAIQADSVLPPGLEVEPDTGTIVGTPTLPGTYTLALALSNPAGIAAATGRTFRLRVLPSF